MTALALTREFQRFLCKACGLIYDEALGDPDSGLAPGTRFEDIPEDWMCPICGVGKAEFELCSAMPSPQGRARQQSLSLSSETPALRSYPRSSRQVRPLLIAGAGDAGWTVAQALRDGGYDGDMVMITSCAGERYHKPQISVAAAGRKSPVDLISETGQDAATRLRVNLLHSRWISGISPAARMVRTSHGSMHYSHLVLAIGARPRTLAASMAKHCWQINQLDDYRRLLQKLASLGGSRNIAMIGGGLVGVELADDLAQLGHRLTLLEYQDRLLAHLAAKPQSEALLARLREGGIDVKVNIEVKELRANENSTYTLGMKSRAHPEEPITIDTDVVIAALGLQTDDRLARQSGLSFDQGYAVNQDTMQTSVPNVYALGDCASVHGKVQRNIEPIMRQAQTIAHHILELEAKPFENRNIPVRLKSRSLPMTLVF